MTDGELKGNLSENPLFLDKVSQENSTEDIGERIREIIEEGIVEKLKDIEIKIKE